MSKPVKLKVYRNAEKRRQVTAKRRELVDEAKRLSRLPNLTGYAIVVWDEAWVSDCWYDTGKVLPSGAMPDFVRSALQRIIYRDDVLRALDESQPEDDGA